MNLSWVYVSSFKQGYVGYAEDVKLTPWRIYFIKRNVIANSEDSEGLEIFLGIL